jgi:hypothetical protein
MVCRDAVVEDGIAIARVWVAAWQAAYPGLMPAAYLAGLNAEAALPRFERGLRANPPVLVLEQDGDIVGFSQYRRTPEVLTPELSEAIEPHSRSIPDTLEARLHAASTLSLNCIRLAHSPGGLHEPLLDHADESETMARDSPCLDPIGVFQFR